MADPAKFPSRLIEKPRRKLLDLAVGETCYIWRYDMDVIESGDCFLDPKSHVIDRCFEAVGVVRKEDGFHVTLISEDATWATSREPMPDAIPVASITEDFDPAMAHPLKALKRERGD